MHQSYQTGPIDEYVILGNDAIVKCTIPSFVADFVSVIGWVDSEGSEHHLNKDDHGNFLRGLSLIISLHLRSCSIT